MTPSQSLWLFTCAAKHLQEYETYTFDRNLRLLQIKTIVFLWTFYAKFQARPQNRLMKRWCKDWLDQFSSFFIDSWKYTNFVHFSGIAPTITVEYALHQCKYVTYSFSFHLCRFNVPLKIESYFEKLTQYFVRNV